MGRGIAVMRAACAPWVRIVAALMCAWLCNAHPAQASSAFDEWPQHGRDADEQRFSPLKQIDTANVTRLGLGWYYQFDTSRGQEATPIMLDGRIFVSTAWSKVFAFDARTGRLLWSYDPKVPGATAYKACCDVVNRGVAVADGRVFVGTLDGRLVALEAASGKLLWSTVTVDQSRPYTITGAPRVIRGKVLIGNGGAEYGVRGYVSAYDTRHGKLVWRFYTVPSDPALGPDHAASDNKLAEMRSTWFGDGWIKNGGGGTVWDAMVYDRELNRLYLGVGNGGPYNYQVRSESKGDNLYLSSIVALDPDTGKYLWHYQETPGEAWDYTASQNMILTTLQIDGKPRRVLLQAPKNGLFYVIDRDTGKPISAAAYSEINWFQGFYPDSWRPKINPASYYSDQAALLLPGPTGVHSWQPMAFDPDTGLVYIPIQEHLYGAYTATARFKPDPGGWNTGIDFTAVALPEDPAQVRKIADSLNGALLAWDPVAQKARWKIEQPYQRDGGILATAGNLIFQGTADGHFSAYAADSGTKLWDYAAGNGIMAGPISYAVDGVQYIAVMAGFGGSTIATGFQFPQHRALPGRLLVFKLDGDATAPAYPSEQRPTLTITDPPATAAVVAEGKAQYQLHCFICHGLNAIASTMPDLRHSPAILDANAFDRIVLDGVLTDAGMVSFKQRVSTDQADAIRLYLQAQARIEGDPR